MASMNFKQGLGNPCIFGSEDGSAAVVHGDDFLVMAREKAMIDIEAQLRNKYSIEAQHINPQLGTDQKIVMLNRVITWNSVRDVIEYEPDHRHIEKIVAGMEVTSKKPLKVPITHEDIKAMAESTDTVDENKTKRYR